ncbi:branched-chain amino acid ABC transporter permease [Methylovirgula sp. 4M-Z18]|uniref:branched-chain amino acid ABC transporter permease n=1 Tax=Methylovirgula sp. 4M-Z18 TaxID=2293567 RepID=UPI000E2E8E46|nr:branched-chain amino acid ABC transporter permease [Methylovirgula sp. 4M-Z18]RFB80618.1 branched-chain amino acid ABC transporter permease [Methylovirgula sp. 4M-Z18]
MVKFAQAALLIILFALTGCSATVDSDQARICRSILPAIHPDHPVFHIFHQRARSEPPGVDLVYSVATGDAPAKNHILACGFGGAGESPDRKTLMSVVEDGDAMSDAQVFFLRRYWLETPEGSASDPAPVGNVASVHEVSNAVAYGLQQTINGLPLMAIYALLAAAYSLVYGLAGRINLAFGEFATIGGCAAFYGATLFAPQGAAVFIVAALAIAASAATFHGLFIGRFVFVPLSAARGQIALVATIGLALFLQEYLRLSQDTQNRWISPVYNMPIPVVRAGSFVTVVTPMAMLVAGTACLVACLVLVTMKTTRFGREWRAYADDAKAATMFGISPAGIFMKTFALASALAGLAGGLMSVFYGGIGFSISTTLGLKALIAAILGGIGSVPGAFLGGLVIGGIETFWQATFPIAYRDTVIYVLLIAILIWRPGGFLGYADSTPRGV